MAARRFAEAETRDTRFAAERARQARRLPALQREALAEIDALLNEALIRIEALMARAGSPTRRAQLADLRAQLRAALREVAAQGGRVLEEAANQAWSAGIDLIDRPVAAGGVDLAGVLNRVDAAQLAATQVFLVDRIRDISAEAARRVAIELGLVVTGAASPGEAIDRVAAIIGAGRARALTIVRTEVGRAYAAAAQARMAQAVEVLPGLKKQWRRSGKLHSRFEHDAIDGQVREVNEPFNIDGDLLLYPRDPSAPPGQTINCGCTALPFMDHWAMSEPARRPFTDREIAADRNKRLLSSGLETTAPLSALRGREGRDVRARLIAGLERQDPAIARARVATLIADAAFAAFARGQEIGEFPVGVLSDAARVALGGDSRIVRFSRSSAQKQTRHHPEMTAADYRLVQELIERGDARVERGNTMIFDGREGAGIWRAVMRRSRQGNVFLASLHQIKARQLRRS